MASAESVKPSRQVYCDICNVFVSSAGLLESHTNGKKHLQLVKLKEEQARASKVSLYITGFKCSETSEDEMSDFFSVYGQVKKIYFDKNKGIFAIVEFKDEHSVSTILETKEPFVFKDKILKIKRRTFASHKSPQEKKGEPSNLNMKKRKKKNSDASSSLLTTEMIKKMNQVSTVSQQMEILIYDLKLTDENLDLRSLICKILKEVFQEFVPSCNVVPYGSSANGLGCKGSDLDITLLIDTNTDTWNIDLQESLDDHISERESKDIHSFIVKVLRTLVPGCENIIPIFTAKCPVIKFTHQTTGISCDLTINNRLGIQNTSLLKCYMDFDPRVSRLVYTVRSWAKSIGVSGGGSGQLTSYALTVMVLYYLQTTDPPVIPSLQDVSGWPLKKSDKIHIEKELLDGWECGFYKDIFNLASSSNTKRVETLLEEFFEFYSKFDYKNYAVSIRNGQRCTISSLEVELEEKIRARKLADKDANENEGDTISLVWKTTPLCVQDPFELTHNLTHSVGAGPLKDVIQYMLDSRNICQAFLTEDHSKGQDKGIVKLFKYNPRPAFKKRRKDAYSFSVCLDTNSESSSTCGIFLSSFSSVESFFQGLCNYLEKDLKMSCIVSSDLEQSEDDFSVVCTSKSNTWTHCRRERRKALRNRASAISESEGSLVSTSLESMDSQSTTSLGSKKSLASLEIKECPALDAAAMNQAPSDETKDKDSPCLIFRLAVGSDTTMVECPTCEVKLEYLGGNGLHIFEIFYAYFKKQMPIVFK